MSHAEYPGFDDPAGRPHEQIGEDPLENFTRKAIVHALLLDAATTLAHPQRLLNCQYCGAPTINSHTCQVCRDGWPVNDCCCENNGDYCEACLAWIEYRRETVSRDYR